MSEDSFQVMRAASATDEYGDPIPGAFTNHLVLSGRYAPNNPAEPVEVGRNAVITGGTVYVRHPSIPDVEATDRVVVRGTVCEIDGKVGIWRRSSEFGVQFAIRAVTD